jgi:hypothetical protein
MTIKDSRYVLLMDVIIHAHGKETDIDLGNWTDTGTSVTRGVVLMNVTSEDGRPVKVRVGHAEWPTIIDGNCKIDRLGSYLLKAYWWAKYLWVKITK